MRAAETAIPSTEKLYRRLKDEWVNGRRVLTEAIDSQGTSCDREKYCNPVSLRTVDQPHLAFVTPGLLPVALPEVPPSATTWDFFAVDDPESRNEAHCEVRVRRTGRTSTDNDRKFRDRSVLIREALKSRLAAAFEVV